MYTVILRTADKRALYYKTNEKVNYNEVTDLLEKQRKINKKDITLRYGGVDMTSDFNIDLSNEHHIVHVIDNSKIGSGKIKVDANLGKQFGKIPSVDMDTNQTVGEFIEGFLDTYFKGKEVSAKEAQFVYAGKSLPKDQKISDSKISDSADINIILKSGSGSGGYLDESDVSLCITELKGLSQVLVYQNKTRSKYASLVGKINDLQSAGFFNSMHKRYEYNRFSKIYQAYGPYNQTLSPNDPDSGEQDAGQQ